MMNNARRRWAGAFVCALLALSAPTRAPAQSPATPSAEELQQLVTTLKDDKARAQLVSELQALIAAQQAQQKSEPPSLESRFSALPDEINAIGAEILATIPVVTGAPNVLGWLELQASDPQLRERWLDLFVKLGAIFGAGVIAGAITSVLLRRLAAWLDLSPGGSLAGKLFLLTLRAIVEALPVLVFAGVATFVMPLTDAHTGARGTVEVIITATVWARGLLAVARVALLSPQAKLLYRLDEETRNYLYIWMRRFAHWAAYGYAASVGAWWLGAPGAVGGLLTRVTVLVLAILAIIFVLQNRSAAGAWLRGGEGGRAGLRILRNRLAETWHILAIIYVVGTFGVYVLNVEGGFTLLLRATALSLIVVAAAAILTRLLDTAIRRGLAVSPELKARFPALEGRVNRYTAILSFGGTVIIYALAALLLLQAWGVDVFTWVAVLARQRATGSIASLAIVIVAGLALWEFFNSMIERRLARIDYTGRSRARTLLPVLRTTLLVVLVTLGALMILSELGLNIAPLLAGAGIAGIAVGFGAQALVKDVITGSFFLLEDTFAIGDIVDVGGGHAGVIEAMSIRNFRLRDTAGVVHTVPFSSVTTVLNMSRDFAYVVAEVGVRYREDPDRVIAVIREAGAALAADQKWTRYVLAPVEILGVERFTDTGMVVRARIKAAPPRQIEMGREFNRLLKKVFDREGIELASANQINYLVDAAAERKAEAERKMGAEREPEAAKK